MPPAATTPTPTPEVTGPAEDWRELAACRGIASSVFFCPDGERGHARARREAEARLICRDCPVLAQCRDHALTAGEPYGIWGGMTETDRRRHARAHRRGGHRPPLPAPSAVPAAADDRGGTRIG
ncbi:MULTISPECIES: WhiB family transcriptional regulator [Rhodococcus]|uniref:Transcriptional regulator WhiB n=1 Tax=Rhodococcus opacus RKJ300 = JCM 13270 TaxID=1165867 RepID=I0WTZ0_RHOOP|nr:MULTISPECIES: WhiB family transcriptional regulator [Rhodococcus]EID79856.1 WhiB family transcriptional regulator [Rhodococcus opacus RKJ300 = JCM 13270]KAF0959212.1 Transcriptional regulator WhiB [Rhodococcus sp. T7]QQZ18221.1 WhiB family transcriptional regulator [Rhodococcus sp. 21391]UOT08148.1 WhiB family transcriptional regulator [Rhodococcus opacus]